MNDDFDLTPWRVKAVRFAVLVFLLAVLTLLLMFAGATVIEWGR
jgi:hypothetical protein